MADAVNPSSLDRATILGIVRDQLAEILEKSPDEIKEDVSFTRPRRRLPRPDRTGRGARRGPGHLFRRIPHRRRGPRRSPERARRGQLRRRQAAGDLTRHVSLLLSPLDALAERVGLSRESEILAVALTHSSYAAEHQCESNERLEFLGDAVVDLAVADLIVTAYPQLNEGSGSLVRSRVVNESSLAEAATALDLASSIRVGRGVKKEHGARATVAARRRLRGPRRGDLPGERLRRGQRLRPRVARRRGRRGRIASG